MLKREHSEQAYAAPTLGAGATEVFLADRVIRGGVSLRQSDPMVTKSDVGSSREEAPQEWVERYIELRDALKLRELRGDALSREQTAFVEAFDRLLDQILEPAPALPADVVRAMDEVRRIAARVRHGHGPTG